jgi:hypothetical protein
MLASISPLGERARGNRWGWTVLVFSLAATAAGTVLGACLGLVGSLATSAGGAGDAGPVRLGLLAGLAVVAGLADLAGPGRVPTLRRQVNEDWVARFRWWVYGAGFGVQLGAGVTTIVTTATVYAWMAAAVLGGSVAAGAVVGASFGLARSLPFVAVAGVDGPDELRAMLRRLTSWAPAGRLGAACASLAVGTTLACGLSWRGWA